MNEQHLRCFVAVAEELSFTRAASRLNTVQPAVSAQIRGLEEDIGVPLFVRDKHHVKLTDAGRSFLEDARKILASIHRAVELARQAARSTAGHITIGSIVGAEGKILSHILPILMSEHPEIQLTLRSLPSPRLVEALQNREIGIALLRGPIQDTGIASEVIAHDTIVAAIPSDHPLARLKKIPVAKLKEMPLVMVSSAIAPAVHDIAIQIAHKAGVQFRSIIETDNVVATLNSVGAGLGFSLLPDYVRTILPANVVSRPLAVDTPPALDLLLAYRTDSVSPALDIFLSIIRKQKWKWEDAKTPAREK